MEISPDIFENTQVAFEGKTDGDLQQAKALFTIFGNRSFVKLGSSLATLALKLHLPVSSVFKYSVYNHFCGGETFAQCKVTIEKLKKRHAGVLLNYGVELKETDEDFDKALEKNMEALHFGGNNHSVKGLCVKPTGYGRFALFEKIQLKEPLTTAEQVEFERVKKRFNDLCHTAQKNKVPLYFDAEESWIQDVLDDEVEELMAKFNRHTCIVYNTYQMYRHDRLHYLKKQIDKAAKGNYLLGAKLVRGAYMEKERERAAAMGYPSPIHKDKPAVDKDFDHAVDVCLTHIDRVYVCVASQSEESCLHTIKTMKRKEIEANTPRVVFSQLYGMGDNVTFNLAKLGFTATKYLPYGPVKEVIPYLIRRAQENTSVTGQTGRELTLLKKEISRRKKNC